MVKTSCADEPCSASTVSVLRDTLSTLLFGRTAAFCPALNGRITRRTGKYSSGAVHLRDFDLVVLVRVDCECRSYVAVSHCISNNVFFFCQDERSGLVLFWGRVRCLNMLKSVVEGPSRCRLVYHCDGLSIREIKACYLFLIAGGSASRKIFSPSSDFGFGCCGVIKWRPDLVSKLVIFRNRFFAS